MDQEPIYIGIDVAKAQLDLTARPIGQECQSPHSPEEIAQVVKRMQALVPTLVVLEAIGGLQLPLVGALAVECILLVVANPRQVRDFATAIARSAKTDRLDAQVWTHFGEATQPQPSLLPDAQSQALQAWLARRGELAGILIAEKNRLGSALNPVRPRLQDHIGWSEYELTLGD